MSNWYARYYGDYMRDTSHLSLAEHGAYNVLLDHYYATRGPLPNDDAALRRICRAFTDEEQSAVASVMNQFFPVNGDGKRHNKRADEEMQKEEAISRDRTGAASARWGDKAGRSGQTRSQRLAAARMKGTHTEEEWMRLVDVCGSSCVVCGVHQNQCEGNSLTKDHIIPIYQGGSDAIDNIQPTCRNCNSAKGNDTTDRRPADWKERLQNACKTPAKRLPPTSTSTSTEEPLPPRPPSRQGEAGGVDFVTAPPGDDPLRPPARTTDAPAAPPSHGASEPATHAAAEAIDALRKRLSPLYGLAKTIPYMHVEELAALDAYRQGMVGEREIAAVEGWFAGAKGDDRKYLPRSRRTLLANWLDNVQRAGAWLSEHGRGQPADGSRRQAGDRGRAATEEGIALARAEPKDRPAILQRIRSQCGEAVAAAAERYLAGEVAMGRAEGR